MILLPLAGFTFYGPLGLLIPAVAVSSQLKGIQSIVYNIINLIAVIILSGLIWTLFPVKDGDPMPLLNLKYEFRLVITALIPVAALVVGAILMNYNDNPKIETFKKVFFKLLPYIPFVMTVTVWITIWHLVREKDMPRLPVMIPSIILLVCGMGMIALPKDLKKNLREVIMVAILAVAIFTLKIMTVDPISKAMLKCSIAKVENAPVAELKK